VPMLQWGLVRSNFSLDILLYSVIESLGDFRGQF
jgi:hypothetical protein